MSLRPSNVLDHYRFKTVFVVLKSNFFRNKNHVWEVYINNLNYKYIENRNK